MTLIKFVQPATIALAALLVAPTTTLAVTLVREVGGDSTTASIQATVDLFRADLGEPVRLGVPGTFPTGRREINWDAVPEIRSSPNDLPPDFFNVNSPRGAVFSTPGTSVRVSANAGAVPVRFGDINPTYSNIFSVFSPQKLFTATGSTVVDVDFFVAGSNTPALVSGFGSVFTDVDLPDSTKIEFFNQKGELLLSRNVLPGTVADGSLSFLGASFGEAIVDKVRITSGNTAVGPNDDPANGVDVVVMDDFLYGEPQPRVPEPSSALGLLAVGIFGASSLLKRKKTF